MNKTDKDFIESKLRLAISLVYKNQTAQALREIADAVSVVAVALESSTSGANETPPVAGGIVSRATAQNLAGFSGSAVEENALAPVKPLCRSGLLAVLSDGGKNPQCPACGLFHERRVVVVELSSLGLHMLKHEGAMRIGGGMDNPEKYRQDDRVIFTEIAAPLKGDVILGNVVKMFSGSHGREAIIEVVKS